MSRLEGVRRNGRGYVARCPAHDDRRPSLGVAVGDDGRLLLNCHAGCPTGDVLAALGMEARDLFADAPHPHPHARQARRDRPAPRRRAEPPPPPDLMPWAKQWHRAGRDRLSELAEALGVAVEALLRLRAGVASRAELAGVGTSCRAAFAWTFPMRDGCGRVIGIRLRSPDDGFKWAVTGGRQGLFVPPTPPTPPDAMRPLFVVEGPSDVAALLTLDLAAVGLPSAGQGGELLAGVLRRRAVRGRVVLLADADAAGERGADAVARELATSGVACRVAGLPDEAKDARAYLVAGGTRDALLRLADAPAAGEVRL